MTSVPILTVPQEVRDVIYYFVFEDLGPNISMGLLKYRTALLGHATRGIYLPETP